MGGDEEKAGAGGEAECDSVAGAVERSKTMTENRMTLAVFVTLSEAYGGDIARWPEDRRAEAEGFAAENAEAAEALAEAEALDRMLDEMTVPAPSMALTARVLGDAAAESATRARAVKAPAAQSRQRSGWRVLLAQLGLGSSALVAGGLGVAAMAGLAVGVIAPVSTATVDQADDGAYTLSEAVADPDTLDEQDLELLEVALIDELFDDDFDTSL